MTLGLAAMAFTRCGMLGIEQSRDMRRPAAMHAAPDRNLDGLLCARAAIHCRECEVAARSAGCVAAHGRRRPHAHVGFLVIGVSGLVNLAVAIIHTPPRGNAISPS